VRRARVSGRTSAVHRFARVWLSVFCRLDDFRVERRDGLPAESSSAYAAFRAEWSDSRRIAFRSVALVPGSEVSTVPFRFGLGAFFCFFAPERSSQ
jgi:hypothetical protein